MFAHMIGNFARGPKRRRQDETDFVLLQQIAGAIPNTSLRAAIGHELKSQHVLKEQRRLFRVAAVEFDEISAIDGERIVSLSDRWKRSSRHVYFQV